MENMPNSWKQALFCPQHKRRACKFGSYRNIALLKTMNNILAILLQSRGAFKKTPIKWMDQIGT